MKISHTPGPWKAHLNAPTAAIPGHLIKQDDEIELPIALLWEGGGTKGKPTQIANAHLIAAAPEMFKLLVEAIDAGENYDWQDWERWNKRAKTVVQSAKGGAQ